MQTRLYEGKEPIQFFVIFQSFQVFKVPFYKILLAQVEHNIQFLVSFPFSLQGGLSSGYKKFIAENGIDDDTYLEDGLALFRIQGSGPENMQAIQVDAVSSHIFIPKDMFELLLELDYIASKVT